VGLCREARHVAYRAYDPGGQYWTYAEDFGKGGAASLYLAFDALVQARDLRVQRPDVAQDLRSQSAADARGGALRSYAAQDARCPVGGERSGYPAGDEIS
jgi:hypothetical protein